MTADPYRDSIHIAAEPDLVFDYFTSATALARWMGDRAVVDPRPGGQFTIFFGDRRVQGRYLELDRPRRLVISWGRAGSAASRPGQASWKSPSPPTTAGRWWPSRTAACPTANGPGTRSAGAITWPASH